MRGGEEKVQKEVGRGDEKEEEGRGEGKGGDGEWG